MVSVREPKANLVPGTEWDERTIARVRIDPGDASVQVVGRIDPVGHPTFVGHDLYLSGSEQLRRIRKMASAP